MKLRFTVLAFSVCLFAAGTPDLSGVWKAVPEKSKFPGQAPSNYLMIIEQKDSKISGTVGATSQHGEERSSFVYNTARPNINSFRGLPMRTKASWEGNTLVVEGHVGGAHPVDVHDKYTLSEDGKTLTYNSTANMNGHEMASTVVLEKQPDSAGEALRKPEERAGAHFKNLKVLADMPASQLIEAMRYFTFALGENCDFCHVQGNFAADDKPQKGMARMMITMTTNINKENFKGNTEVRCYTCHQGHPEPHSVPE